MARGEFVASSTTSTAAPLMAAPSGTMTGPRITPRKDCALAGAAYAGAIISRQRITCRVRIFSSSVSFKRSRGKGHTPPARLWNRMRLANRKQTTVSVFRILLFAAVSIVFFRLRRLELMAALPIRFCVSLDAIPSGFLHNPRDVDARTCLPVHLGRVHVPPGLEAECPACHDRHAPCRPRRLLRGPAG